MTKKPAPKPAAKPAAAAARAGASGVDAGLVRELAGLLSETDLTEIEVEKGDLRIRVARETRYAMGASASAPGDRRSCRSARAGPRRSRGRGARKPSGRGEIADGRHRLSPA